MQEGAGNATRFTFPYHAWSYSQQGELVGVYAPKDFGDIDKSCHGLVELPTFEKAGLIWVVLDQHSTLNIETLHIHRILWRWRPQRHDLSAISGQNAR